MELNLFHMYPDQLNLYGDTGNVNTLIYRCQKRGIDVKLSKFSMDNPLNLDDGDLFFIGGGSDYSQKLVYEDFLKYQQQFKDIINSNKVVLAVCGGYQLLGKEYIDKRGDVISGLNILDYTSKYGEGRLIGNIIIETGLDIHPKTIVGFENHNGRTYSDYDALGKVRVGYGNNGHDFKEGIIYKNYIGTYLHGPVLPKNPHLADYLILKALQNKYNIKKLDELDDDIEFAAHDKFIKLYG